MVTDISVVLTTVRYGRLCFYEVVRFRLGFELLVLTLVGGDGRLGMKFNSFLFGGRCKNSFGDCRGITIWLR